MVYGIKGLLKINEYTYGKGFVVKSIPYFVRYTYKSMDCRVFFSKSILMLIYAFLFFEETIDSIKYEFFKDFVYV